MKRVLLVGDSPILHTGFGTVNAQAARAFQDAGMEVASVAGLTTVRAGDVENGIRMYYPDDRDILGRYQFRDVVADFKPDFAYMTADAGTATALGMALPSMPALAYIPIEGEPIGNNDWRNFIRQIPVVTCSKYGVEIAKRDTGKDIPYVYHGVDHDSFKVNGRRDETRTLLGWTDKFVITAVATNVRRKQIPRLIAAFAILKNRYKQKDMILYLHTVPFQGYWLDGHNLEEVCRMYGVGDDVFFNDQMKQRNDSIPLETFVTLEGEERPGLVDILNASDIGINCSQVEGFSLTNAEMMACGLPVLTTKYAAGWEVVQPAGRGIPVTDWEVHKSSTLYANVKPDDIASEVLRLRRSPKELKRMSEAGLIRAKDFDWAVFRTKIVEFAQESYDAYQRSNPVQQETDTTEVQGVQDQHLRPD